MFLFLLWKLLFELFISFKYILISITLSILIDFHKFSRFQRAFHDFHKSKFLSYFMWSKCFANSFRKATSYTHHSTTSFSRKLVQERFQSSGAHQSVWKNGMLLGAGALGITCAYLTHKTFALNQDPVCFSLFLSHILIEST